MHILKKEEDFIISKENGADEEEEDEEKKLCSQATESGNVLFDTPVQRMEERLTIAPLAAGGRRLVHLRKEAMNRIITQFERKLATILTYEPEDRRMSYADVLVRQARQYRRYVEGSQGRYTPLMLR
jgi:hypothetical protein